MRTHVQKWGNSLAVRIPKAFAADLGLSQDSSVDLLLDDGCLVVKPAETPRYELQDLLAGITATNIHPEQDFGSPAGAEEW